LEDECYRILVLYKCTHELEGHPADLHRRNRAISTHTGALSSVRCLLAEVDTSLLNGTV